MEDISNIFNEAVQAYESGNFQEFKKLGSTIYDAFACFPCPLERSEHKYLLGTIFSYFAPLISKDINYYTCALENAYYCLSNIVLKGSYISEKQCAAIRLLLLIHKNKGVMVQIVKQFADDHVYELYNTQGVSINVMRQIMENAYEEDILRMIGGFLISENKGSDKQTLISAHEMSEYDDIVSSNKYSTSLSLTCCDASFLFGLLYKYFEERIRTPYDRRISLIYNVFTRSNKLFD